VNQGGGEARDRARLGLGLAALRALLVPLLLVTEDAVQHLESDRAFEALIGLAAVYAAGLLAMRAVDAGRAHPRLPERLDAVEAGIDLALLCALIYTSGGALSQVRNAFFLLPIVAAVRLRPRLTAAWAIAAVVADVTVSLAHPGSEGPEAQDLLISQALYLAWVGAGAVVLSDALTRGNERIAALAAERGRLAAQALDAEERERRRLAEALHDDAVQNLLHARQELAEARRGDSSGLARADEALARTVGGLRHEIVDLHPRVLDHAGLPAAVEALAERHARGGAEVSVEVEPGAAGRHDHLLLSLARELLSNAARHADARHITVRLAANDGNTLLEVRDDGRGFAPGARERAVAEGHIGLATAAERVAAIGGTFTVRSTPGGGATVRAVLPEGHSTPPLP
jgi:two-component system NarL family sensor kinase